MQMEAETSDLLDRRVMQLFAVANKTVDKGALKNVASAVNAAQSGDPMSPYGPHLLHKLREGRLPELGLTQKAPIETPSRKRRRTSLQDAVTNSTLYATERGSHAGEAKPRRKSLATETQRSSAMTRREGETPSPDRLVKQADLRAEYNQAYELLMKTGQLPITIDKNCLGCMSQGRDQAMALKMFKTACLSY